MTDVCLSTEDQLKAPLQASQGDERCLSATADHTEARRSNANGSAATDIRHPAEEARAAAIRAPARVKRTTGSSDVLRALENRHRWLLFAQHCYTCSQSEAACDLGKLCTYGKKTLKHVANCKREDCSYPRCALLKPLLQHSRKCQSSTCAICVPVWNYIQRELQQQQQLQPPPPASIQHQHQYTSDQRDSRQPDPPVADTHRLQPPKLPLASSQQCHPPRPLAATAEPPSAALQSATCSLAATARDSTGTVASLNRGVTKASPADSAAPACTLAGSDAVGRLSCTGNPRPPGSGAESAGVRSAGAAGSHQGNGFCGKPPGDTPLQPQEQQPQLQPQVQQRQQEPGQATRVSQHLQQQQQQQQLYTAVAPQGTALAAPGTTRVLSSTSDTLSPYTLSPYGGAVTAPAGSSPVEVLSRPPKGIMITATPPQPIPVISCAAIRPAAGAAGQPQLVHSYPPSASSGPPLYSHVSGQHPQAAGQSTATVTTPHWLPLPGLAAVSGPGQVPGVGAPGGPNGAPGAAGALLVTQGCSGAGGATAGGPAATAIWHSQGTLRPGPVAVYGIASDGARPGGVGALASAGAVQAAEQYGHTATYTFAGANGSAGISTAAGALGLAAAPFLLWPGGQPTAPAAQPASAVAAGPQGTVVTHLATQYAVGASAGPRLNNGTASYGVGGAPAATAMAGLPSAAATALVQPHHLPQHTLLYGTTGLPPSAGGGGITAPAASLTTSSGTGGGAAAAGGSSTNALSTEVASGPPMWSYLIR